MGICPGFQCLMGSTGTPETWLLLCSAGNHLTLSAGMLHLLMGFYDVSKCHIDSVFNSGGEYVLRILDAHLDF